LARVPQVYTSVPEVERDLYNSSRGMQ